MNRVSSLGALPRFPAADRRRAFSLVARAVVGLTVLLAIIAPFSHL